MELAASQIILIGFIVTLIAQGVKLFATWRKTTISRLWVSVIVLLVSLVLAYVWNPPAFPTWPAPLADPAAETAAVVAFILAIVQLAAGIVGISLFLYNIILGKVFTDMGLDTATVAWKIANKAAGPNQPTTSGPTLPPTA
jgi:hypothetical protein